MAIEEIAALSEKYLLSTYNRIKMAPVKGDGIYVEDSGGRRYLDFVSGIAVTGQGHCHPRLVAAIKRQAEELIHCSNLFLIPQQALLAEKLCTASGLQQAFFCNSGAEANEAALKLARKWGKQNKSGASEIVTAQGSFHGRTLGALSATGQRKYQRDFEPLVPGFKTVPFGDLDALNAAVGGQTAAILLEPVQGEGGVHPAPAGYLEGAAQLAQEKNVLLILDEVQTGLGRTGKMFAFQHSGIQPDVLLLAKALGGGIPIGALLAGQRAVGTFRPGDHASTFGGSPLAAAAALAAFAAVEEGLVQNCAQMGTYFKQGLRNLQKRRPVIEEVRGMGLLLAAALAIPAQPVVDACRERGLLILTAGERVLRFLPPLIVNQSQIDAALEILAEALLSAAARKGCEASG